MNDFPPRVGSDSCHTCGREFPITGMRQDWNADHSLSLECWPCWEIRMGQRDSLVSILSDYQDSMTAHGPFSVHIVLDDCHDNGDPMIVEVTELTSGKVHILFYEDTYDPYNATQCFECDDPEGMIDVLKRELHLPSKEEA
jgi:hypothetical protein